MAQIQHRIEVDVARDRRNQVMIDRMKRAPRARLLLALAGRVKWDLVLALAGTAIFWLAFLRFALRHFTG